MWSVGQRINIEFLENQEFIVVKRLEGGMGYVYKVVDSSLVRSYSIKSLKQTMSSDDFKKECQIFVTASLHESCVKPIGYGLIDLHPAIAYPWYASSLENHDSKNWETAEIIRLINELMNFFQYSCFDLNILHCDIKPSNILLDNEKKAFVTDFGISKMIKNNECMHAPHAVAGTREYMAPELLFTNEQTVKSELYSFGITIYEFLTGEHPYANEIDLENNLQRVSKNIKILKKRVGKAMLLYIDFIERCISIESSKRPENFKLNGSAKNLGCLQPDHKEESRRTLIDSISMQASYYRKENNYIKSEQILHDAINSYGKDPVLLNGLGITYADSRSREEAIVQLEEASEIIFEAHGLLDSLLYLDPIMNLSIQYRCTTRHHDAFVVLNRAWQIFRKHHGCPVN